MKKMNIKALLINHVEKIIFGIFGLTVLILLARTSWSSFPQTPDAMKQKVKEIRDKISAETNVWPEADRQAFKIIDFNDKARQLFAPMAPIALARYSFTPPLFHPLYRKDEPRREPTFEPVQYLIAKSGMAALSMINPEAKKMVEEVAQAPMEQPKTPAQEDGEFAIRKPTGGAAGGGGGGTNGGGIAPPQAAQPTARPNAAGRPPGGGGNANPPGGVRPFTGMPGGMNREREKEEIHEIPPVKALGVRYVAVRGVFPLAKQIENYKNALKMSHAEAQTKLDITGFVLERQRAVPGENHWNENLTKWEPVNVETTIELLSECSEFDSNDPVPIALQDADITMPLPLRLLGVWTDAATHPKIRDLELHDEALEQQNNMLDALDNALNDTQSQEPQKARRRGFGAIQRDVKSMVSAVKSAPGGIDAFKNSMQELAKSGGGPGGAGRPPGMTIPPGGMMRGQELDRLIAASKYILFRCFDFDVESGVAYRYRVRLIINNPNFDLPPEELAGADPEIANGETRLTPWSNISNPVVVDNTFNYFLRDIERDPYREEKIKAVEARPVAQLDVFDWDTSYGTMVKDLFNLPAIGAFIGGLGGGFGMKRETTVLDLVDGTIQKKKDRKLTSMDVLIDVEPDYEIPIEQHPDLKLNGSKGSARLGLTETALVATSTGDLKKLDPSEDKATEELLDHRFTSERANFKEGSTTTKTKSRLGQAEESEEGNGTGRRNRGRNTLRARGPAPPPADGGVMRR